MKVKEKKVTDTKVSENGVLEQPTLQQELESIVKQHNEAAQRKEQHLTAAKKEESLTQRCLGAIEILERIVKSEEKKDN